MKRRTREEIVQSHIEYAEPSLKDHVILQHDQIRDGYGIVAVGRPKSGIYRCYFTLTPGYLTMTGDLNTLCWGFFHGKTVEGAIEWMGCRESPMDHYFNEKVGIGMGSRHAVSEYDSGVALADAKEYLKQAVEEAHEEGESFWTDIIRMIEDGFEEHEVLRCVHERDFEDSIGMVPTGHLMWAWSMVRRAHELLRGSGE